MKKLFLTSAFHFNLDYSSIPINEKINVINICYKPLLEMFRRNGFKVGIEMSGKTLEDIARLSPDTLKILKDLVIAKNVEILGSGYVQNIMPLCPEKINRKNLAFGRESYQKILNVDPKIAYVDEQCFSKDLIPIFKDNGYNTIIIDFMSSPNVPDEAEFKVVSLKDDEHNFISVLWNNTLAFQMLQRCVYGQIEKEEYDAFLTRIRTSSSNDKIFMFYGSDVEVFNYRPRKGMHSGDVAKIDEIGRLEQLMQDFIANKNISLILPSECIPQENPFIRTSYLADIGDLPISTKKQGKYNVVRWAVCGPSNMYSNTMVFNIFKKMEERNLKNDNIWKRLVELYASDYRSNPSPDKIEDFKTKCFDLYSEVKFCP